MSDYKNEKDAASQFAGVWATTIGVLAGMAWIIGIFNGWPTHETVGALLVAVVSGSLAVLAFRAENRWRRD